ncbi:MAG: HigA family addiction module antitoxin [Sinimarinibacterium sp.]
MLRIASIPQTSPPVTLCVSNRLPADIQAITTDTAIRLARHFGTSEKFWMGLQADYDLEEARKATKLTA